MYLSDWGDYSDVPSGEHVCNEVCLRGVNDTITAGVGTLRFERATRWCQVVVSVRTAMNVCTSKWPTQLSFSPDWHCVQSSVCVEEHRAVRNIRCVCLEFEINEYDVICLNAHEMGATCIINDSEEWLHVIFFSFSMHYFTHLQS